MLNATKTTGRCIVAGLASLQLLTGCKKQQGGPAGGMPPVQVIAVEAKRQAVTESLSLVGSIAANEMVEIKSETEGIIQEILFNEGQPVEKGQLLVRLDDSKLAAAVSEAESSFKLSQANFERAKELFKGTLISQQEYDQASRYF
jgi:membrane fusion protein (multidrug efflux system)